MTAPIKTPAKAPAPPVREKPAESLPTAFSARPAGDKRAASGGALRSDLQASRSAFNRSTADTPINADGLFFSQLLVPPVVAQSDQQSFAGGAIAFSVRAENVPTELIDEVVQRLPDQPDGPLAFTLLMPNLGSVRVNASKADNRWSIQLGFARRDVLKRLHGHAGACRESLSEALGQDVDLSMHEDFAA
ncbi:type III secretion system HrpP C-terminal domain-containing protein [Pseudomonas syringae pv. tagetis]|uniref:Type III secretion protein HrpP n=2 Tax=Pseudomonas syringae group genomosp. 7 TaxID=251699 RepID=Q2LJ05_9PSED|nr:type III secretion system HrpP C-terminal domain-containing protein [Pseudomonas syringae group genomosp. 7]ABB91644.1 type III secretion protein HrpP [Pseudomonas syringae pv. tagetis]KPX46147.1 Type III secretion protein HrpP [Pseudomonas syringae pv. helianthi]KPY88264.1 Type III secretion protein HrpP [Pseudomonas syringae pv. tagetis]RMR05838.1 Type III secretion protein HrpP [Pseudomonas syringae pv. helianthi]RMV45464.1 Type III secretion protein HrpP [Pseudomonas syringae pv. helian